MKQQRGLTAGERALLSYLLARDAATASLAEQVDRVRVVARCDCGCPTIELEVGGPAPADAPPAQVVADAEGQSPEGAPVGILVFARAGRLSALEVYSATGEAITLPAPEAVAWIAPPAP